MEFTKGYGMYLLLEYRMKSQGVAGDEARGGQGSGHT